MRGAADGRLYGTTTAGGSDEQRGTIFSYDPVTATVTDVAGSAREPGYFPRSELLLASDGNFYGTAVGDGARLRHHLQLRAADPADHVGS